MSEPGGGGQPRLLEGAEGPRPAGETSLLSVQLRNWRSAAPVVTLPAGRAGSDDGSALTEARLSCPCSASLPGRARAQRLAQGEDPSCPLSHPCLRLAVGRGFPSGALPSRK